MLLAIEYASLLTAVLLYILDAGVVIVITATRRIVEIAITTINSTRVKPFFVLFKMLPSC
jgi:hypothetical protein